VTVAGQPADDAVVRVREIAEQLRELELRLEQARSTDVEMSLLERAAELADEAVRLLERFGRGGV
jgi:HEPN domain-containing protein